jgi:hypothetical protein
MMRIPKKRAIALAALLTCGTVSADIVTLIYDCANCASPQLTPAPTNIQFDETTQLFEDFTVSWNNIDFDFTFPNSQPAFVREWFWDALNGLPVTPTALPDSGPVEVFPIRWFADAYTPDRACFNFFVGASGAGPRCVEGPFSDKSEFPVNVQGVAESARNIPEPGTLALAGIGFCGLLAVRVRRVGTSLSSSLPAWARR